MPASVKGKGRYEIKEALAQGGMGVVYRAHDKVMKRPVALKTLLDFSDPKALQLFQKECEDLASMIHPNIIEIFDIGQIEEDGQSRPYLVMPLLPGMTLDKMIRTASQRLTTVRSVEIICQACRGLHAAHERGLIHRDVKPSNIFVMDDDSVKIIDFGIAHRVNGNRTVGRKGTLLYMAPEQIQLKPLSALSDIFSLGVVCYEALTRRRPFERSTDDEVAEAILHSIPPPASDLNPALSAALSQVIHKAMAKQPWHRFSTAREFGETLQKALHNAPIEIFNPARIRPRLQRAAEAFERSDVGFAAEILGELEAEGHLDPAISQLRIQIDQATRQNTISQLLESACTRIKEQEYTLALQKVQEVLQLDPKHAEALNLKSKIGSKRTEADIDDWFRLARQHMENFAYGHAREALQRVLELRPKEGRALQLLSEVDRLEENYVQVRQEKEQLYRAALEARQHGDVTSALSKLERALELDRQAPEVSAPGRGAIYQNLYNQVRSERDQIKNAYAEARQHLENRIPGAALTICNEQLSRYPGHALFQALKFDAEEQHRQSLSARIAEIDRCVESEPDLDRRVSILEEAIRENPGESHFERSLQLTRDKRDLVDSIVQKARGQEERGQFNDALAQWEILQTIYSRYPGLPFEIERLIKRREQNLRFEAKNRWAEQIDRNLETLDYARALELLAKAQQEFPADAELAELEKLAHQGLGRSAEAQCLLTKAQEACSQRRFEEGLNGLRQAFELDDRSPTIRAALLDTLVEQGRAVLDQDPCSAEELLQQALELEPAHALAKGLLSLVEDHRRRESADRAVAQARQMQTAGDLKAALEVVNDGLLAYPNDPRMTQLHSKLRKALQDVRRRDLEELKRMRREAETSVDLPSLDAYTERMEKIAQRHPEDEEFDTAVVDLRKRLQTVSQTSHHGKTMSVPGGSQNAQEAGWPEKKRLAGALLGKPLQPIADWMRSRGVLPLLLKVQSTISVPWVYTTVAAILLLTSAVIWRQTHRTSRAQPPVTLKEGMVEITTAPRGARIWINGEERGASSSALLVKLPEGSFQVEARMPGYQVARSAVEIKTGAPLPLLLTLQPEPLSLRLFGTGRFKLNGEAPVEIEGGELVRDVAPGQHTVKISSGRKSELSFQFEVTPDGIATVMPPVKAKELAALLISNFGGRARLYGTGTPLNVKLDGRPAGQLVPGGLDLPPLSAGNHEVELGEGKELRKKSFEIGSARSLTAILDADPNAGTLVVHTDQSDVAVIINGKRKRGAAKGQLERIPLTVGTYVVQVVKEGFQAEPAERSVQIQKGEDIKLEFTLRPISVMATLLLRTEPGAEILLEGKPMGAARPDGTASLLNLSTGRFMLEIRKKHYRPEKQPIEIAPGQNKLELQLTKLPGTLILKGLPAGGQVTYKRTDESTTHGLSGSTHTLAEGSYSLNASAPGHLSRSYPLHVTAGEAITVELSLEVEKRAAVQPAKVEMEGWENPGKWVPEGEWFVHTGGGLVKFSPSPARGKYSFRVSWQGGNRFKNLLGGNQLQWFVHYVDNRNYLLFKLEDKSFSCEEVKDGKHIERIQQPVRLTKGPHLIHLQIAPDGVSHTVDGQLLQSLQEPGANFAAGHFGFKIDGKRQVMLKDFRFEPR